MNKFEQIFKSLNIPAWEIPETIANILILKHFLKDEYPFLNFFHDNSNYESKKYIKNLILSYPDFFDNENLENWLHQLWTQFSWKMNNYQDIKTLVHEISKFDEKDLKDFYNYFLDILEEKSYKTWYMPSPKEVNILAKNILNPKNWTFYSPVFWVWKNFVDISKNNITSFNWQEYSYQNFLLAKIYLEINNLKWSIKLDSFENDQFEWETFDYSFSIPPFGLKYENIKWNTDFYFINKVINHLKKDWKWVIISPLWTVFKVQAQEDRKNILKKWLEAVILLPKWSFLPYSSVQTILYVFNNNKKFKDKIFFIDWLNSDIQEISDIYLNKNEWKISNFWTYEEIEKNEFNLDPLLYIYSEEKALQNKVNWSIIPILKLSDIPKDIKERFEFWWKLVNEKIKFEELKNSIWNEKEKDKIKKDIKKSFMNFVVSEALKYDLDKYKLIDLVEEWAKWLDFAIDKFKLEDDTKFMSFARYYIKLFIDRFVNVDILETKKEDLWSPESESKKEFKTIEEVNEELVKDNLKNLKNFNNQIHKDIIYFLDKFINFKWYSFYPRYFNKVKIKDWNKQVKDSMRLANIISLNSYIYNNDENKKIEKQFDLVKYFDEQLDKEWKLEAKKEYARKLFTILKLETFLLFIVIWYVFYRYDIESLIKLFDLLKWFFWLTLWQMTLMVFTIVKYLFPKWKNKKDN